MSKGCKPHLQKNNAWRRFRSRALNLLFPDRVACASCGREAATDRYGLCEKCAGNLRLISQACVCCGRVMPHAGRCRACAQEVRSFTRCVSVCEYTDTAAALVKRLKFGGKRYIAPFMARLMHRRLRELPWHIDMIVPVPMFPADRRKRGYNQTVLLAKALSDLTGLPWAEALTKVRHTELQVGLNRSERLRNLRDAFAAAEGFPKGADVLILDDVFTTGATVEECARTLKQAGAGQIWVLCFASGKQNN